VTGRPAVPLPVLAAAALVGATLPSFSAAATGYVLGLTAVLAGLGLSGRLGRRPVPPRPPRAALWWLVPVLLVAVVELVDFVLGSTYPHPSVSRLLDPPLSWYPVRALAYFGWLAAFYDLARR
jgi:hypothetical protein